MNFHIFQVADVSRQKYVGRTGWDFFRFTLYYYSNECTMLLGIFREQFMGLKNMKIERFIWHTFNLYPFCTEGTSAFKKEVTHKSHSKTRDVYAY